MVDCREGQWIALYTDACFGIRTEDDCPKEEVCCLAQTATCLACQAHLTVDEYCEDAPETVGCISDDIAGGWSDADLNEMKKKWKEVIF